MNKRKLATAKRVMELVTTYRQLKAENPSAFYTPYPWQDKLYKAGASNKQRLLMAANRVGKTYSAAFEVACHATGMYPDWWEGARFDYAPKIWCLGVTGEQMRDVIQKELFGDLLAGEMSGAMIPKHVVQGVTPTVGVPRLAKDVRITHPKGQSVVSFKSYSQGQHVLMGSTVDFAWVDEEPQDITIYPQLLTRTATGNKNKGGYVLMTFTPENGMTELVTQFMEDIKPGQWLGNVTWDDAPHLDNDTKAQLLDAMPEYQREMRSKGIPVLGEGMVFPISEDAIRIDPFAIPAHWTRLAAMDFGIDHPTAAIWAAYDSESDVIYITDEYAVSGEVPAIHAAAIKARLEIPVVYPADGDQTEKGSGKTLAEMYRSHGLDLIGPFTNPDGTRFVEPGLMIMLERMRTGRLKIFGTCGQWFSEFRRYHRKNGKIVKQFDDVIDASRYCVLSIERFGEKPGAARDMPEELYPTMDL